MLTGSLVALVTPFDHRQRVDYAAVARLIEFHIDQGSDGLVIAGTTGESPTLVASEHGALIQRVVELADGRIPVIAGTGPIQRAKRSSCRSKWLTAELMAICWLCLTTINRFRRVCSGTFELLQTQSTSQQLFTMCLVARLLT